MKECTRCKVVYPLDNFHLHKSQLRSKMRGMLKRMLSVTKCHTSAITLGYTAKDLQSHLESLFRGGMPWQNRSEWHIDHIKSVSAFITEGVVDPPKS